MIRCVRCCRANSDAAQFCDECGTRLPHDPEAALAVDVEMWRSRKITMVDDEPQTDFQKTSPSVGDDLPDIEQSVNGNGDERAGAPLANDAEANVPRFAAQTSIGGLDFSADAAETNLNNSRTEFAEAGAFQHARLVIERGKNAGKEFALSENEVNIGRWDADNGVFPDVDLDADDPEAKVSRRHARIMRHGTQYLIEDLSSTNGTFVNRGRRLLPNNRQVLNDGDEIIVGKTFLRFQVIR